MQALEKSSFTRINAFQRHRPRDYPTTGRCRARGARYLYIVEKTAFSGSLLFAAAGPPGSSRWRPYGAKTYWREYLQREILCAKLHAVSCVHRYQISRLVAPTAPGTRLSPGMPWGSISLDQIASSPGNVTSSAALTASDSLESQVHRRLLHSDRPIRWPDLKLPSRAETGGLQKVQPDRPVWSRPSCPDASLQKANNALTAERS